MEASSPPRGLGTVEFLQICPCKVSRITPTVSSLPANISPGVVMPGGVWGGAHQAVGKAELC